jgi:hypothetical protein
MGDTLGRTTRSVEFLQEKQNIPLIDAHMHIQSNDIAPVPIMYGLIAMNINTLIHRGGLVKDDLKHKMNFVELSYTEPVPSGILRKIKLPLLGGPAIVDFANEEKLSINIDNMILEVPLWNKLTAALIVSSLHPLILAAAAVGGIIGGAVFLHTNETAINIRTEFDRLMNSEDKRQALTNLTGYLDFAIKDYGNAAKQNSFFLATIYKNQLVSSSMGFGSRNSRYDRVTRQWVNSDEDVQVSNEERQALVRRNEAGTGYAMFGATVQHYYGARNLNIRFTFNMSVIHSMELLYAHYWGAYGIPIYIPYGNNLYYLTDNIRYRQFAYDSVMEEDVYNAYDIPGETIDRFFALPDTSARNPIDSPFLGYLGGQAPFGNEALLRKSEKYCHFLKKIPEFELGQFEDYSKHIYYTKAAAVKYPLQFMPFYHVDPRRFFSPVDGIPEYHDFYTIDSGHSIPPRITKLDSARIKEAVGLAGRRQNINGIPLFPFKTDVKEIGNNLLDDLGEKYQDSGKHGLFWGVKMYAALGCPPFIVDDRYARNVFPALGSGAYTELLEFFKECAAKNIPVTCHGSPQGMTIADPPVYLKEFLKQAPRGSGAAEIKKINFSADSDCFLHGIGLIDSFSSPESWRKALEKMGGAAQDFTLCLAHFGGQRYFDGTFTKDGLFRSPPPVWEDRDGDSENPCRWLDTLARLIHDYRNVYVDISCFTFPEYEVFPPVIPQALYDRLKEKVGEENMAKVYPKTYVEGENLLSYYEYRLDRNFVFNPGHGQHSWEVMNMLVTVRLEMMLEVKRYATWLKMYDRIYNTARTLEVLLRREPGLKERILFGTDWPMTEMSVEGIPYYNSALFTLLQLVSVFMDNSFDAWHQFAVLNPLRFLGILEEVAPAEKTGKPLKDYTVKLDGRFKKMEESIRHFIDSEINRKSQIFYDNYKMTVINCTAALERNRRELEVMNEQGIPAADKMAGNGGRLLLTNYRQGERVPHD